MGNSISLTKIVCLYLHGNGAQFLSPDESMVGAGMVRETLKHMYVYCICRAGQKANMRQLLQQSYIVAWQIKDTNLLKRPYNNIFSHCCLSNTFKHG